MLLTSNTADTYFKLANDIDITGNGTIKDPFYGHLDGGNNLITFRSTTGNGLFARIAGGASLKNLKITGRNIPVVGVKLNNCTVGNLANENYGGIYDCAAINFETKIFNAIDVKAGGFVGNNFGIIERCYSKGDFLLNLEEYDELLSDWNIGWGSGFVAVNKKGAVIRNCYSHMNVSVEAPS